MTTCWVYPDRCMTHVFYLNFKLVPRLQYPDETRKFSCFFFSLGILIWCNSGSGLALLSLSLSLSLSFLFTQLDRLDGWSLLFGFHSGQLKPVLNYQLG